MSRHAKLTTGELRLPYDLRKLADIKEAAIRERMFGPQPTAFAEGFFVDRDLQKYPPEPRDISAPRAIDPTRRMAQMRRILDGSDEKFISKRLPKMRAVFMAHRRGLLAAYVDEFAYDLDILWTAKRALAEMEPTDHRALLEWRLVTRWLIFELKVICTLHGCHMFQKQRLALIRQIEATIQSTMNEVEHLLPATEGLR